MRDQGITPEGREARSRAYHDRRPGRLAVLVLLLTVLLALLLFLWAASRTDEPTRPAVPAVPAAAVAHSPEEVMPLPSWYWFIMNPHSHQSG